jgi:hypothetical protein
MGCALGTFGSSTVIFGAIGTVFLSLVSSGAMGTCAFVGLMRVMLVFAHVSSVTLGLAGFSTTVSSGNYGTVVVGVAATQSLSTALFCVAAPTSNLHTTYSIA